MQKNTRSAGGYRARAEKLRTEAETIKDERTRKALLNIAANYEQLANSVEKPSK